MPSIGRTAWTGNAGDVASRVALEEDLGGEARPEVVETLLDVDGGKVDPDIGEGPVHRGGDGGDLRHGAMQGAIGERVDLDQRRLAGLDMGDLGLVDPGLRRRMCLGSGSWKIGWPSRTVTPWSIEASTRPQPLVCLT